MKKIFLLWLIVFWSLPLAGQSIWYVNAAATGAATGQDWTNAFTDLQAALALAQYSDEIWVARGVYYPTSTLDRDLFFGPRNGVGLYGGFIGNETERQQRNFALNPTVLSGNIGDPASATDNSRNVVQGYNLDHQTILDGFVIEGGYAEDGYGGGLSLSGILGGGLEMKVRNCLIRNNFAMTGGGAYVGNFGEASYALPEFSHCTFERNEAILSGGGFVKDGPTLPGDTFTIADCRFIANFSKSDVWSEGGAMSFGATENAVIRIQRCIFDRDSAFNGGAIASRPSIPGYYAVTLIIDSCQFLHNWAWTGGALYYLALEGLDNELNLYIRGSHFEKNYSTNVSGSAYYIFLQDRSKLNINLHGCTFVENNKGPNAGLGGVTQAILKSQSELNMQVSACIFDRNNGYAIGNQIGSGPGFNRGKVNIFNSLFLENDRGIASASTAENNYFETEVRNCTFFRNSRSVTFYKVIYPSYKFSTDTFNNRMLVENCIVWDPEYNPLTTYGNHNPTLPFYEFTAWGYTFRNCVLPFSAFDTISSPGGDFYEHNFFKIYPEFADTLLRDYRLALCSPIVNQGANQGIMAQGISTDLDGLPRIVNDTADIGAYEQQLICTPSGITQLFGTTDNSMEIRPNPSTDEFLHLYFFDKEVSAEGVLYICDAYGRIWRRQSVWIENSSLSLALPDLPGGMYWVEFRDKTGKVFRKKWLCL